VEESTLKTSSVEMVTAYYAITCATATMIVETGLTKWVASNEKLLIFFAIETNSDAKMTIA